MKPTTIHDVFSDSQNFDIYQTAREVLIREATLNSRLDHMDTDLLKEFHDLCQSNINIEMFPIFAKGFLSNCLNQEDRSLNPEDYPLPSVMEYVANRGYFSPQDDREKIPDLEGMSVESITNVCKSLAFRGLCHWNHKYNCLTMKKIDSSFGDYDYDWLHI